MITLKQARMNKGVSQVKLASSCGVSRTMIINIEQGKNYPSVYLAQKIGKILELDWWELYPDFTKGVGR